MLSSGDPRQSLEVLGSITAHYTMRLGKLPRFEKARYTSLVASLVLAVDA